MSEEWKFLKPIFNDEEVTKLRETLNKVVIGSGSTVEPSKLNIIKQSDWIAVPTESGDHFSEEDEIKLLQTVLQHGNQEIVAIAFEPLKAFPSAFVFPATAEAIAEFNHECGHFWFTLYAGEPDWVIVGTKLDFLVITGKHSFVSQFLGYEIQEAFADFYELALSYSDDDPEKKSLLQVYNLLWREYPKRNPGEIIQLLPVS
ncbi:hypothetical protein [Nostoc sp. 'Lobaria pulmonaria (5183) cyanobiont']|uniref:hypothetical protein n=1 Tax=Nostoc sp. 'Lobaria pulmonaria (5183) cyanobiont' TaxID=1618022 RepID=UPI000CF31771|nr:hypothetical protein [Nostoc sp. 'Lobaria pulmonaria (5183) cyanobiont']AVH69946.1 hypothetical protein NLP_1132 [Nostoc sp. 'Lobaria pulmonaria (5183) cyanobiont']